MAQNVSAPNAPIRRAQGKGSDIARTRQFEWLARAGIATRGAIYAIIGVLAIKLAFGERRQDDRTRRAPSRRSRSSRSARRS